MRPNSLHVLVCGNVTVRMISVFAERYEGAGDVGR